VTSHDLSRQDDALRAKLGLGVSPLKSRGNSRAASRAATPGGSRSSSPPRAKRAL
jgi:hypothetical protein